MTTGQLDWQFCPTENPVGVRGWFAPIMPPDATNRSPLPNLTDNTHKTLYVKYAG